MSRHNSRRLTALNLLTILLLLCSLPLPASVAARAPASAVPLPVDGESSLPAANVPSAALALEAHALEPPALPVALELSLAAPILHPDESTELAVAVTSESAEPLEELWLTLKLPPGVTATPRRQRAPGPADAHQRCAPGGYLHLDRRPGPRDRRRTRLTR